MSPPLWLPLDGLSQGKFAKQRGAMVQQSSLPTTEAPISELRGLSGDYGS